MGSKNKIIGFLLSAAIIFVWFVVRNEDGVTSDYRDKLVSENNSEKPELIEDLSLSNFREGDFSSEPADFVSSGMTTEFLDGLIPRVAYFFQTGKMKEIRDIPRNEIRIAVEAYVSMQSRDQLEETLHQYLGMPFGLFSSIEKPEDYLMEIVDLVRQDIDQSPPRSNLIITDACAADGSVSGSVHIIPSGTSRIYAVFENSDALQGIENIYAVWRDLNDDTLTFSEYEPLRRNSSYNYVWLELEDGWSGGGYQLDLADSKSPSRVLATTKFKVQ